MDLYYKTHRSQFRAPERVRVLHIVKNINELTTREEAQAVMTQAQQELEGGMEFSEVAKKYSDCGENGGDLSWFPRDVMVEEFEEAVFDLAPGETTGIFESRFGMHIARLVDRRPAEILPLREVYEQIAQAIYEQRLNAAESATTAAGCPPVSR